jgi:tripartite ATP-independent transporter DctP family solute receptor
MKANATALVIVSILVGSATIAFLPARGSGRLDPDLDAQGQPTAAITLVGASQFDEKHVYTRTLRKFEELVNEYYDHPVKFEIYLNSELGLEKEFFAYMSQGIAVDLGIVSASHMSTFSPQAPLLDMPYLFRDREHWEKVMDLDVFESIEDRVYEQADVLLIGYAGGGVRNLIVNKPVSNMDELRGLRIRVMGAPIQTSIFQAISAAPTVIAYSEVYSAIQTGVIEAAENESIGIQQMKFYEVGPEISLTQHAITVRPIAFSGKTFRRLAVELQEIVLRAGREAGEFGRREESAQDAAVLAKLEADGKLQTHVFIERDEILRLVEPIKQSYARDIGAQDVLARINSVE